jgi:hypothetical protein
MKSDPQEIVQDIKDCKTIAQLNKLFTIYFKELMTTQEKVGIDKVSGKEIDKLDILTIMQISIVYEGLI